MPSIVRNVNDISTDFDIYQPPIAIALYLSFRKA